MLDKSLFGLLLVTSFPLLAQTDIDNSSYGDDWEAANCPGALPADEPPYARLMKHYVSTGDDELFDYVKAKQYRYWHCDTAITTRYSHPIAAFNSYRHAIEVGDIESAENIFSLEATLEKLEEGYSKDGAIYSILEELYEEAYSQQMSDMMDEDHDAVRELLTREYFCECLTQPLEEFDIPGYPPEHD